MLEIKLYVSSLKKYVEGRENGRWIRLPMLDSKLKSVISDIVGNDEELIILDYQAPFEISEYQDIRALNGYMQQIADDVEEIAFKLIPACIGDMKESITALIMGHYEIIDVDAISEGWQAGIGDDLFGRVLYECGYSLFSEPIPEEMIDYIDFSQVYTCMAINDGWQHINYKGNDYLVRTW